MSQQLLLRIRLSLRSSRQLTEPNPQSTASLTEKCAHKTQALKAGELLLVGLIAW
jgi:hypothetical protein